MPGPHALASRDQGRWKQEWLSLLREGASEQCSAWARGVVSVEPFHGVGGNVRDPRFQPLPQASLGLSSYIDLPRPP